MVKCGARFAPDDLTCDEWDGLAELRIVMADSERI